MIWIFKFFDFLSVVLPVKIVYFVSEFIGVLTCCLGLYPKGRKNIVENLRKAGISSCGFSNFVSFARSICEFVLTSKLNKRNLHQWMELVGIDRLKKVFNEGKGVIVLTGHLGDWELGAAALSIEGYPTNMISMRFMNPAMTDFYERKRKGKGQKVIYSENVRAIVRALRGGEVVAIIGDRTYGSEGENVQFFGKTAKFPLGPFRLAQVTQAPIVIAFTVHEEGRLVVYFEEPIFVKNKEEISKALSRYVAILEKRIKEYPDEWYAFDQIF